MSAIERTTEHGHTLVTEHNGVLYLGGIAAEDLTVPLADQTRQALTEVDRVLAIGGSSKASILQARVNLKDFNDKDAMHAVWLEWLDGAPLPARSTNGAVDMGEGVLIEVVVIAAREA